MTNAIQIVGYASNNKVPGFFAETVYGAGPLTAADIPLRLLVSGTKLSTGTATADQDIDLILSETDADTLYGAGSEIAVMCYGALQIPGVTVYGAANAEAGGAVGATATITIAGTWSAAGTFQFWIDGEYVTGGIASTDTVSLVADAIVVAVNANTHLSVTAAKGAGTAYIVTLTRKSKGLRGNQGILWQDKTLMPSGMTSAIAGGTDVSGALGLGCFFGATAGSGADVVTTLLTKISADQYDRIAAAQNDATNAAAWKAFVNTQAGPLVGITEHVIMCNNASLAASKSIAQTSVNAERVQYMWFLNSETIPSRVAATFAAYRTLVEQDEPGAAYDGYELPGVKPQRMRADWPSTATLISALDNSLTPIATTRGGAAYVVRSITSKSLTGSNPDYRTLDTSEAVVPDYVRADLRLFWLTVFLRANPKVGPDAGPSEKEKPAGVATPTRWNQQATGRLKLLESRLIISDVNSNPMVSEYNTVADRIMSIVPTSVTKNQHSIGVSVRQVA